MAVKIVSSSAVKPKPGGAYEKADKVFSCCAKYYAVSASYSGALKCAVCGKVLSTPLNNPQIYICK